MWSRRAALARTAPRSTARSRSAAEPRARLSPDHLWWTAEARRPHAPRMRFEGEFAALATAFCWGAGSNFFAAAGRSMGAVVLNRLRISMALVFLAAALLITHGSPWPTWATGSQVTLLGASGLIGFVFGDNFYFRSLLVLGPGRASMMACLAPPLTALFAVPLLGEKLGPLAFLGMGLTLTGVAWS